MKERRYERDMCVTMKSSLARQLQGRLMNEERPFEMRMRSVAVGLQEVELRTDAESYEYFKRMLSEDRQDDE